MVRISTKTLISSLLLSIFSASPVLANQCKWPDGSDASAFLAPCDPNASSSPCCSKNEVCLDTGLCYAPSQGLWYRGGCQGSWSDSACPNYCNDIVTNSYGNIYGCPIGGYDQGFKQYWCGGGVTCQGTGSNGHFLNLDRIGNVTNFAIDGAYVPIGNAPQAPAASTVTKTTTATSVTTTTTTATVTTTVNNSGGSSVNSPQSSTTTSSTSTSTSNSSSSSSSTSNGASKSSSTASSGSSATGSTSSSTATPSTCLDPATGATRFSNGTIASSSAEAQEQCHTAAVAGGIAGPLSAAALAFAALWLFEIRKRRSQGAHVRLQDEYGGNGGGNSYGMARFGGAGLGAAHTDYKGFQGPLRSELLAEEETLELEGNRRIELDSMQYGNKRIAY